jgi:eukaryotic-like serine/threonine-protein kinase
MAQLLVVGGPDAGRSFPLRDGQALVIGRGQASDTQINDPRMSRVHCRLELVNGQAVLHDAGGSGGTLVAGSAVERHALRPGDTFQVGDSVFRYQIDGLHDQSTLVGQLGANQPTAAKPEADVLPLHKLVGQSLAHFRLDEIITAGNTGMVFKATDTEKDRTVAVKVLSPDTVATEEAKERFIRAMKTMLPIQHENIVRLYYAGKRGPYCWAAMEYVEGESLASVIRRAGTMGMLEWRDAFWVAVHIGRALAEAAEHKIIHRNVTPPNILQRKSDKVCKLGDLMLAKALEGSLAKQVTKPGQLIGDVPYMAPERTVTGGDVDERSDLYGLGATLYAVMTGRPPFDAPSLPELIRLVRQQKPEPPKTYNLAIPDLFQDAVMRLLEKRPEDRYQTAEAFLRDVERIGRFNGLAI